MTRLSSSSRPASDRSLTSSSSSSSSSSSNVAAMRFTRNILAGVLIFMGGANVHRLNSFSDHRNMTMVSLKMHKDIDIVTNNGLSTSLSTVGFPSQPTITTTDNNNYQLAFDESYGFFDDLTEDDWKYRQSWAREQIYHRYGANWRRHYGNPALWYYNNYYPVFSCPHLKRVWGIGDGPKWICDVERLVKQAQRRQEAGLAGPHCLIYSVGSNGNYEFEDGLISQIGAEACEIHIFDYSHDYDRPENKDKNIHFHQWGLQGSQQNRGGAFVNFPEIVKKLGHENHTIDIFKIDCEGCEWDTYKDWIGADIRQVLVETHELPKDTTQGLDFFEAFRTFDFAMFSKEVNGFGGGNFYEFAYIKLHPDFMNHTDTAVAR